MLVLSFRKFNASLLDDKDYIKVYQNWTEEIAIVAD